MKDRMKQKCDDVAIHGRFHNNTASCEKDGLFVTVHLVEDESLADVSPVADGTKVVDKHQEKQHKGYTGEGVNGTDQEHHDQAAKDAQCTGMPGKTTK